ncbi:MAG TPA: tetratricopeptide repeat protein [Armatimonadota bacterium]|nr:tetratricopeptide repeat protein [Armatimonadota bacterium]
MPREVQQAQQRRSRRIATALIAVAVVIAGLLVARSISGPQARFRNVPPSEQHNHAGETTVSGIPSAVTMPPAAPARPDAGEAPPALAEPSSLARSFPTQTPGEPPVLAQQPALQNPVLAELQGSILELESAPVSERDTYRWNVAAGDCYWLYARELALSSPSAPREHEGERALRRLREDRFATSFPSSQEHLRRAELAYRRALELASTPEHRARVHQRLGDILCARGKYAQAWEHAQRAQSLIGDDPRTAFLRARCLLGMKQPREKRASSRKQSTGGHDNG